MDRDSKLARELRGRSVAITGASGLIGRAVAELVLDCGADVIAAGRDIERMKERLGLHRGLSFVEYDATRLNDLTFRADYLVIAASPSSPDLYVSTPVDVIRANTSAVDELLRHAASCGIRRTVFVSSSEVYGRMAPPATGFTEDRFGEVDISNPRNCYAEAKRMAELLCVSYARQYGLDVSIVRPGHVYGPTATERDMRVASLWTRMAARGEDITMKSEGRQLRSYVHGYDCATAILTVLLRGKTATAYNVSNRKSVVTVRQLAEEICRFSGVTLRTETPSAADRSAFNPMDNSSLDATRLEDLGWSARFDLATGLADTIKRFRVR